MDYYLSHIQDVHDYKKQLDHLRLPVRIVNASQRPKDGSDADKWARLNALFHRGVVGTFSKLSGYFEHEAKEILQVKFALVADYPDYYLVESVAGMSLPRLIEFIDHSQMFLAVEYGERADELLTENINRILKTKKVWK